MEERQEEKGNKRMDKNENIKGRVQELQKKLEEEAKSRLKFFLNVLDGKEVVKVEKTKEKDNGIENTKKLKEKKRRKKEQKKKNKDRELLEELGRIEDEVEVLVGTKEWVPGYGAKKIKRKKN